jgi:hypothetical protein
MTSSAVPSHLSPLSEHFVQFAVQECRNYTPLYERLAIGIAADAEVLALASHARPGQPVPNLLLAAVQELLLKGSQHPLRAFYPSITPTPATGDPYLVFRAFCLEHRTEIETLLAARTVQTNEIGRTACLYPAFSLVAGRAGTPLFLVEVGCSAGLLLLWDRYAYDYGDGRAFGDPQSPVRLRCELRPGERPPLPPSPPSVQSRVGIDLNPLDARDPDAALWLRALVWPEHRERAERLLSAIRLAQQQPPKLLKGDALAVLPGVLATAPPDAAVCVFHCHTLNQFPPEARERFSELLSEASRRRPVFRLSYEGDAQGGFSRLSLTTYRNVQSTEEPLARCGQHGQWLEWVHEGA